MTKLINPSDFLGLSFNGVTVAKFIREHRDKYKKHIIVEAQCYCGKHFECRLSNLQYGNTKSCGCRQKDNPPRRIHGLSGHKLNQVYGNIIKRCYDAEDAAYCNYGARGIKMCDEWKNDFVSFYQWCLENGWEKGLEVDRKNNDGNYGPANCRIVNHKINMRNRRCNRMIEFKGQLKAASEWAEEYNISDNVFRARLNRGWEVEKALTQPQLKYKISTTN